jgi:hypothetical protein
MRWTVPVLLLINLAGYSLHDAIAVPPVRHDDVSSGEMQDWIDQASLHLGLAVQRQISSMASQQGYQSSGMVRVFYRVVVDTTGTITAANAINPPEPAQIEQLLSAAIRTAEPLPPPPIRPGKTALPVQMVLSMTYSPPLGERRHQPAPL